jgi:uncharacterized SAM-binding protein YcdF (DUF218 family)
MFFFELSKLVWFVLEPLNLLALLLIIATIAGWLGRPRYARRLVTLITLALLSVWLLPLGQALTIPLEQRFKPPNPLPARVDGIILLGGAQRPILTRHYRQPITRDGAETMTAFLALARQYPEARLVFSGGSGDILNQRVSEAETMKLFLEQQGFDSKKVQYESRSRNTFENAVYSKRLVKPAKDEVWLLVATASGMPRAVGVFRHQGWSVIPFPCSYRALPELDFTPSLSAVSAFQRLEEAVHEWVGLAAYYLAGKTDTLFPAPPSTEQVSRTSLAPGGTATVKQRPPVNEHIRYDDHQAKYDLDPARQAVRVQKRRDVVLNEAARIGLAAAGTQSVLEGGERAYPTCE